MRRGAKPLEPGLRTSRKCVSQLAANSGFRCGNIGPSGVAKAGLRAKLCLVFPALTGAGALRMRPPRVPPALFLTAVHRCVNYRIVTGNQLKRWLAARGCTRVFHRGKGTLLPRHGSKELPTGTGESIKRALGLK